MEQLHVIIITIIIITLIGVDITVFILTNIIAICIGEIVTIIIILITVNIIVDWSLTKAELSELPNLNKKSNRVSFFVQVRSGMMFDLACHHYHQQQQQQQQEPQQ